MIKITRGVEPSALAVARKAELQRIRDLPAGTILTSKVVAGSGKYTVARDALWQGQHYKCCYCESQEQRKRNDVEHFRPKTRAERIPGCRESHGYWWLAWTWENLFFSCRNCNQSPAKLSKFPLENGSEPLVPEQQPPGKERPLLIDPATESSIDHIRFRLTTRNDGSPSRWIPTALTQKGRWTIKTCMLDRPDLLDMYNRHIVMNVRPLIDDLLALMGKEKVDPDGIKAKWKKTVDRLLPPSQAYVALARDAIDHYIPAAMRSKWGLSFPVDEL